MVKYTQTKGITSPVSSRLVPLQTFGKDGDHIIKEEQLRTKEQNESSQEGGNKNKRKINKRKSVRKQRRSSKRKQRRSSKRKQRRSTRRKYRLSKRNRRSKKKTRKQRRRRRHKNIKRIKLYKKYNLRGGSATLKWGPYYKNGDIRVDGKIPVIKVPTHGVKQAGPIGPQEIVTKLTKTMGEASENSKYDNNVNNAQ